MQKMTWWKNLPWRIRWVAYGIIIIISFYTFEDLRGYLALKQAKKEYIATGLRLDFDEIRGPRIPDAENFAASEIFSSADAPGTARAGELFPAGFMPKRPSNARELNFHGFRGKIWEYPDQESHKKYKQDCRDAIAALAAQLRNYIEAAKRPSCDWWTATDPSDSEASKAHLRLGLRGASTINLYQNTTTDPEVKSHPSHIEMILGNLDSGKHFKSRATNISHNVAVYAINNALVSIADGINRTDFSAEELQTIERRLQSIKPQSGRDFIELETALILERHKSPREARLNALSKYESGVSGAPPIKLPKLPFNLRFRAIDYILSELTILLMPRGWIWQGDAIQLQRLAGTGKATPNPIYLLVDFDNEDALIRVKEREEESQISNQLATLAVKIEIHRLETGVLPTPAKFDTGSPNMGYGIEANGQPMLWYSEKIPIVSMPTGEALADFDENHLWRYPPPED